MIEKALVRSIIDGRSKKLIIQLEDWSSEDCFRLYCYLLDRDSITHLELIDLNPDDDEIYLRLKSDKLHTILYSFAGKQSLTDIELNLGKIGQDNVNTLRKIIPTLKNLSYLAFKSTYASIDVMNQMIQAINSNKNISRLALVRARLNFNHEKTLSSLIKSRSWKLVDLSFNQLNDIQYSKLWMKGKKEKHAIGHFIAHGQSLTPAFFRSILSKMKKNKLPSFESLSLGKLELKKGHIDYFTQILEDLPRGIFHPYLTYSIMEQRTLNLTLISLLKTVLSYLNLSNSELSDEAMKILVLFLIQEKNLRTVIFSEDKLSVQSKARLNQLKEVATSTIQEKERLILFRYGNPIIFTKKNPLHNEKERREVIWTTSLRKIR